MHIRDSAVSCGTLHLHRRDLVVNRSDILTEDSEPGGSQHGSSLNHPSTEDRAGSSSNSTWPPSPPPLSKKLLEVRFSSRNFLGTSLPISPVRSRCHPSAEINHPEEQVQKTLGSRTGYRKGRSYAVVGCNDGTRRRPALIRDRSNHDDADISVTIAPGFDSLLLSSSRILPPEISSASSSSKIESYTLGSRRGIWSSSLWGSSLSPTTTSTRPEECCSRSLEYIMRYADASCPRISTKLLTGFPGTSNPPPSAKPPRRASNAIQQPRAKCGCRGFTIQINSGSIGISFGVSYRVNGVVIRRTWSDLGSSSYSTGVACRDSVQVYCLEKSDRGNNERDILEREGRLAWSGLIKVVAVASSYHVTMGQLASHANDMNMRLQEAEGASSKIFEGVLDVEEGDILVRVDDVQVQYVEGLGVL